MTEKEEKEEWKRELKEEIRRQKQEKKPNGFSYFTLGFNSCALIVSIVVLIFKIMQR